MAQYTIKHTTRQKFLSLTAATAIAVLVGACASDDPSASTYSREQTLGEMTVRMGVVESVNDVNIAGTKSPVGPLAGAAVGGIAGSTVGQGNGSNIGAVLGAVAGGLAGGAIENSATKEKGFEITIKLDNGTYIAVTQAADEIFKPGDRVKILSGKGATRVSH